MDPIVPELEARQIAVAKSQPQYVPLVGCDVHNPAYASTMAQAGRENTLVLAFRPSDAERVKLCAGEPIYVSLLTFGGPMQPILLTVGKDETAATFGIRALE